jgi:hypothetical protein
LEPRTTNRTLPLVGDGGKVITLRSILRLNLPLIVLIYCAAFNWSYVKWVSPTWSYTGLVYKTPDTALLILGYALAAVLCMFSPIKIRRTSQVIYWILYFTILIPALFVPLYLQLDDSLTLFLMQLSLTGGMLLIALSYKLPLLKISQYPLNRSLFWTLFILAFIVCTGVMFVVYRNNLSLASFEAVYSVRFSAKKAAQDYPLVGYFSGALSNVLNPFLIAYGIAVRRRKLAAIGVAGQIFVYATAALKSVLVSPALICLFYYSLKRDRGGWVPRIAIGVAGLFAVLTTFVIGAKPGLLFNLASMTLVRTFAMPGMLVGQYQFFFEHFPRTYLGHVAGISLLFPNPYNLSTGMEIGSFYLGGGKFGFANENVTFFAMDGIAGFGLPGIPIMGALCAGMFWVLDSCTRNFSLAFCASALTMCTISLTNGSLFSTLLGGGLFFWLLIFVCMPESFRTAIPQSSGRDPKERT